MISLLSSRRIPNKKHKRRQPTKNITWSSCKDRECIRTAWGIFLKDGRTFWVSRIKPSLHFFFFSYMLPSQMTKRKAYGLSGSLFSSPSSLSSPYTAILYQYMRVHKLNQGLSLLHIYKTLLKTIYKPQIHKY